MRHHHHPPAGGDQGIDLVPLIDCVFLLLLFFMLCGHLTARSDGEQITVPPARTAADLKGERQRLLIHIRAGEHPALSLGSSGTWIDLDAPGAWPALRSSLDNAWERAGKRLADGVEVADAVVEVRADGEVPFRVIQALEAVCADSVDPASLLPRTGARRPFRDLDLTVRPAG